MTARMRLPEIRVEGTDDLHSIQELLHRHQILCSTDKLEIRGSLIRIIAVGNDDQLLDSVEVSIRAKNTPACGFVIDADDTPQSRWAGLLSRLKSAGIDAPQAMPSTGFTGFNQDGTLRAGVWLMPDNHSPGMLEHFMEKLIQENDPLLTHAIVSADLAKDRLGAKFIETHRQKARLHTWLAWQVNPGRPFGVAVKSGYFEHDSPLALAFVKWVRDLCGIPD